MEYKKVPEIHKAPHDRTFHNFRALRLFLDNLKWVKIMILWLSKAVKRSVGFTDSFMSLSPKRRRLWVRCFFNSETNKWSSSPWRKYFIWKSCPGWKCVWMCLSEEKCHLSRIERDQLTSVCYRCDIEWIWLDRNKREILKLNWMCCRVLCWP